MNKTDETRKASKPRKKTENSLRKQIYDLKQLLEISKSLSSVLDLSTLIESMLYTCMCQMRTIGAGLLTRRSSDSVVFSLDNNYNGMDLKPGVDYAISTEHPAISLLAEKNTPYTLEELVFELGTRRGLDSLIALNPTLLVPLKLKNTLNGILLLGERIDLGNGTDFTDYEKEQILNIASLASIAINNAFLMEMTTTDTMTHLKQKHFFFNVLFNKLEEAVSHKLPVSVLMLDIDFFKKVNDTYGHACGDFVLQEIAVVIKSITRAQDLAARYGGEEFVVMLYNTTAETALKIADRIRQKIQDLKLIYQDRTIKVTISIGIATADALKQTSAKELVERADTALYASKRNGRNRVTFDSAEVLP